MHVTSSNWIANVQVSVHCLYGTVEKLRNFLPTHVSVFKTSGLFHNSRDSILILKKQNLDICEDLFYDISERR